MSKRAEVIVCDDHIAIRTGVIKILEENNVEVVGQCGSVDGLIELVRLHPDAVVISDLGMDNVPLRDLIGMLRGASAQCKIVIYSMREAAGTMNICYSSGVLAYILKSDNIDELINAVRHATEGKRYISPSVQSALANFLIDQNAPTNVLTETEMEIFIAFAKKEDLGKLAHRLDITDRHIQNALSKIVKKLGLHRSEFTDYAKKKGLIE